MHEIKFRAKSVCDNGSFLYGDLIHKKDGSFMIDDGNIGTDVSEETIGQYIGMKDKNGKDIYEGDIIESRYGKRHFVKFDENQSAFVAIPIDDDDFCPPCILDKNWIIKSGKRVIGNLFDNKKLLKEMEV